MRKTAKALAIAVGVLGIGSVAVAHDPGSSESGNHTHGTMPDKATMDRDGMSGMMAKMQQMGSMMEQCSEMMATMTGQMRSAPDVPYTQDDNG